MSDDCDSGIHEDLARRVAHEVRSPLGVIAGGLREVGKLDGLPPSAVPFVELALRSAGRLERLSLRLEWIAKLQSGRLKSDDGRGLLSDAVDHAARDAQRYAGRSRIGVEVDTSSDVDRHVALAKATAQGLQELVHNAIVHAKTSACVRVVPNGSSTMVLVSHDGAPLDGDDGDLFEPQRGTGSGTGLGLWLAHQLLSATGARIEVRVDDVTVEWPD
jgi:signal transduction histidine kinase